MKGYIEIDDKIQRGSSLIHNRQVTKGCDLLLEAWEGVKCLINEREAADIFEIERMYPFTDFLSNYVQELCFALHNAGVDNPIYHEKRIKYCTELLEYCGGRQNIIENTRRAIAESYSLLGDMDTCGQLFDEWLRTDPGWGWGYIGWSDCYCLYKTGPRNYEKGENILRMALAQPELRDKVDVIARLIDISNGLQNTDKVREYKALLKKTMQAASPSSLYYKPAPIINPDKTGRNEPCPCGSGKKYKKCCGAKMVG